MGNFTLVLDFFLKFKMLKDNGIIICRVWWKKVFELGIYKCFLSDMYQLMEYILKEELK